ncbi:hypothetical protein NDU88_004118 [Pleurodeles waltl]|uniref:Uncharacterized protein n=1 Tax=Pleurodeles waltl TaxID=8319 RepID=A0AAV7PF33_PLEWA|nr:hypothetical protein NDU88_004118 [Pleurodeles waltl]
MFVIGICVEGDVMGIVNGNDERAVDEAVVITKHAAVDTVIVMPVDVIKETMESTVVDVLVDGDTVDNPSVHRAGASFLKACLACTGGVGGSEVIERNKTF